MWVHRLPMKKCLCDVIHSIVFRNCKIFRQSIVVIAAATLVASGEAFAPVIKPSVTTSTQLNFGIPTFQPKKDDEDSKGQEPLPKKELSLAGIVQLITAGAGAPFLGDFQGVDEETGNFM